MIVKERIRPSKLQLFRELSKLKMSMSDSVIKKQNTDLLSIWLVAELTASLRMPFSCCSRVIWLSNFSLTCWNYTTRAVVSKLLKVFMLAKFFNSCFFPLMQVPRQLEKDQNGGNIKKKKALTFICMVWSSWKLPCALACMLPSSFSMAARCSLITASTRFVFCFSTWSS